MNDKNAKIESEEEIERFFTLWRTCNAMYETWSKPYGFSPNETLVLHFLAKNKDCTQKKISESLQISKQTVNMILKRFENDSLVTFETNGMDRRSKFIIVTEKGHAVSDEIINDLNEHHQNVIKKIGIDLFRLMNDGQEVYIKSFKELSGQL